MVNEKIVQLRIQVLSDTKELKKLQDRLRQTSGIVQTQYAKKVATQMEVVRESTNRLNNTIKKTSGQTPFAGWAMSIMFAGMAVQRLAIQLKQFGTKAYDDITHSVEGSVTANDKLNASMTMLGFSVGEALQPFLESLIPIVDTIANWVEKNPELIGHITEMGIVLGTLAAAGGALILAKNGFGDLLAIIRNIPVSAKDIKNYNWGGLGSSIANGIGIISIFYAVKPATDAFKDFADGEVFNGIINGLSAASLAYGGIRVMRGAKGGGALIVLGVALELVSEKTFFQTVGTVLGPIVAAISSMIEGIIHNAKVMWAAIQGDFSQKTTSVYSKERYKQKLEQANELFASWDEGVFNPWKVEEYDMTGSKTSNYKDYMQTPIVINNYGDINTSSSSDFCKQLTNKFGVKQ